MNRRFALSIGLGALLAGSTASAQEVTIGYQGLPYKSTGESNAGIQLSEGVLLHAGIGVEAGYDTNVFYAPTKEIGSSIFRFMPYAGAHQRDADGARVEHPASSTLARACSTGTTGTLTSLPGMRTPGTRTPASRSAWAAPSSVSASRTSSPASKIRLTRTRATSTRHWDSDRGAPHPAHQQPGLHRRPLVAGRRSADRPCCGSPTW